MPRDESFPQRLVYVVNTKSGGVAKSVSNSDYGVMIKADGMRSSYREVRHWPLSAVMEGGTCLKICYREETSRFLKRHE